MGKLPKPRARQEKRPDAKIIDVAEKVLNHTRERFVFSFSLFDRRHELFNLGGENSKSPAVSPGWFIDLLDCFANVSEHRICDLKGGTYDLHPVYWKSANTRRPAFDTEESLEFYQIRVNKSKGRIIGVKVDNIFYVVWLDRYHNFIDSEGYGGVTYGYAGPKSEWEIQEEHLARLKSRCSELQESLNIYEQLVCDGCDRVKVASYR